MTFKKKDKKIWFVIIPMVFMLSMTLWSLCLVILRYKLGLLGFIGGVLLLLAILLILEAIEIFEVKKKSQRRFRN